MSLNYNLKTACLVPVVQTFVGPIATVGYGCSAVVSGISALARKISIEAHKIFKINVSEKKQSGFDSAKFNAKSNAKDALIFLRCTIPLVGTVVALGACYEMKKAQYVPFDAE